MAGSIRWGAVLLVSMSYPAAVQAQDAAISSAVQGRAGEATNLSSGRSSVPAVPSTAASSAPDIVVVGSRLDLLGKAATASQGTTASELTPGILKSANIVYVGFLSGLGSLRDPLFESSGFGIGASYDELIDRASGRRYKSDWGEVTENRTPHRDYGYLASFPGAAGTRIVIVAGTRDAAVMQAAEVTSDKAQLDQLVGRANSQGAFEALYEVRTLGNLNLGARLVLARPLRPGGMWRSDRSDQTFTDQLPASDRLGADRKVRP